VTEFEHIRELGRLDPRALRRLDDARHVIGHCRLSTVPGTRHPDCSQPLRIGRFVVSHNGTVDNVDTLREAFGFSLQTGVDSESIGHVLHRMPGATLAQRVGHAIETIEHGGHCALVVFDVLTRELSMTAISMPLWRLDADEGTYWCSIRPGCEWESVQ